MSRFFIDRPIVAIVIAILTVIGGIVMIQRLPIAQYPDIVPPMITITATYTGADAITVEEAVATPIEQQMNGVQEMIYMKSINANDGTMTLQVSFEVGTDINLDQVYAQNRQSQAMSSLPPDVVDFGLTVKQTVGLPLLIIPVYSPNESYDAEYLGNYVTINIKDAIGRLPGVGQVTIYGTADYAMRIWVNADRLAELELTVNDLLQAIDAQNTVNPAGKIGAEPAPPGQEFTNTVRAQGRLRTPEEFGEIILRENPDGSVVRLRDVSRTDLGSQTYNQIGRYKGVPATIIALYQIPGSNALATANAVKAEMEAMSKRFPDDIAYAIALDTTLPVSEGIKEIIQTLAAALLLVILVVFIFLQGWRPTLIPLIAVPVSLIGAFVFFPALGFSINTLSLLGLVLAIGLVVDDAIVVVEAVEKGIEDGLSPRDATIRAMDQVSSPVIGIALILAAVFIPIAFVPGISGRLYQQFALTIAISVLISAFNALSLSPALSVLLLRPKTEAKGILGRFFAGFNRGFERATNGYMKGVSLLIRRSMIPIVMILVFTVLAGMLGTALPTSFIPEEDQGYFFIQVSLPDAASLQRTDAVCKEIETILAKTEGIESYSTVVGFSVLSTTYSSYSAVYFVGLKPWDERKGASLVADGIIKSLNARLAELPSALAFAFPPPAIPGIGTSGGFDVMLQDRSGGTPEYLAENSTKFIDALTKRPEISRAFTLFRPDVPQFFAKVDRTKLYKLGVDADELYSTLQALLGSVYINEFNRFGRQWKVFLQAEPELRIRPDGIDRFYVRNASGEMVPLSALVEMTDTAAPEFTYRFNLFRSAEILGSQAPGYSSGQAIAAVEDVANQVLPSDMSIAWTNMSYQEQAAGGTLGVFALSLVIVFLVLAALYESWSLPWSVLLTVPVAVFGAFLGLWMRGFDSDVFGQIGLIMLIGLVAKNAILIVEFAKDQLDKGDMTIVDAALAAARLRLRPILMTSFAFILGCVPLWIATGAGGASRQMLGTTVITGMLTATSIAIFIVPGLFVIVERFAHRGDPEPNEPTTSDAIGPGSPPGSGIS